MSLQSYMYLNLHIEVADSFTGQRSSAVYELSKSLNDYFSNKTYGEDVLRIDIGLVLVQPQPGYEEWYKLRKPRYIAFKSVRSKLTGEVIDLVKTFKYEPFDTRKCEISQMLAVGLVLVSIMVSFISCNNRESKKPDHMLYAEHRISFIVMKAECFTQYDTSLFKTSGEVSQFLKELRSSIVKVTSNENTEFLQREMRYDTIFNYVAYADAQLASLKKKVDTLSRQANFTDDDIEFLELAYLYRNCSAYFTDSWYLFPEIKFSEDFYRDFFKTNEKKLFEHYLYDNDTSSNLRLSIVKKYPGTYDYLPLPHIIDKTFSRELLTSLNSNNNIGEFLKDERKFFGRYWRAS